MPYRTYLTAPPGVEPSTASEDGSTGPRERYVPGLARAFEPTVPHRWQGPLVVVAVLLLLAGVATLVVRATADANAQDPSLLVPGTEGGADEG